MNKLQTNLSKKSIEEIKILIEKEELDIPDWVEEKSLNEVIFAEEYIEKRPMRCLHGNLYDMDGLVPDEKVKSDIYLKIKDYVKTGVDKRAENLLKVIKLSCQVDEIPVDMNKIHFLNGTYEIGKGFSEHKEWSINRLPVAYNSEAPEPERWLQFLEQLLDKDDIETLQEFMGYTLIPCTRAQTMLLIIGKGGEGKSRIGVVLRNILGINMNTGSLKKLESNRFCLADQETKLLLFDDDMSIESLPSTNVIKAVVTAEGKMDMEQKGKQSYQGNLYVRLMGLGNGALKALYDRSQGFYRRQLILNTKDKPIDRVDDKNLSDKLLAEVEGIVLWCIKGLERLVNNGYMFSVSDRAQKAKNDMICENNNIVSFLASSGYIKFGKNLVATSKSLYSSYSDWCYDNAEKPMAQVSFFKYLGEHASELSIEPVKNLHLDNRKSLRGYKGVEVVVSFHNADNRILIEPDEDIISAL